MALSPAVPPAGGEPAAHMTELQRVDPDIYRVLCQEAQRQEHNLELIASENVVSRAVLEAQGSILTNKYAHC